MTNLSFPRTAGRAALAASAAALLTFGLAAPAAANPDDKPVRGQYVGNAESGTRVSMSGGSIGTTLFNMRLEDGAVLTMYCIDFETNIQSKAWYLEDAWADYPGKGEFAEPAKVHWILQNAYPNVSAKELGQAAGVNGLSNRDALGATQAAIWHFSNDVDLKDDGNSDAIKGVYAYLVENAEELPQTSEPDATLKITPGEASGQTGETVGEFTIETSASSIPVDLTAPDGVELVDLESGEAVTTVGNGDRVGFSVPADAEAGEARFSLETTASVQTGRLFKGESKKPTQTLVTAKGGETTVSASASATWVVGEDVPPTEEPSEEPSEPAEEPSEPAEEPSEPAEEPSEPAEKPSEPADDQKKPTLPVTGGALAGLVAAGVAALGAGGGALYLSRKRKAANSEDLEG